MLEVKIDLVPFGIEARRKQIGYAKIWNDGTGDREIGNYKYIVEDESGSLVATGEYKGFNRNKSVFYLMKEILDDAI